MRAASKTAAGTAHSFPAEMQRGANAGKMGETAAVVGNFTNYPIPTLFKWVGWSARVRCLERICKFEIPKKAVLNSKLKL